MKTYSNLSALILAIITLETRNNPDFKISGYDLTKRIQAAGLKRSHQQIYREIRHIDCLDCTLLPQEGKPDAKLYSLLNPIPNQLSNLINVAQTKTEVLLAIQDVYVAYEAYQQRWSDYKDWQAKLNNTLTNPGVRNFHKQLWLLDIQTLHTHLHDLVKAAKNPDVDAMFGGVLLEAC